MSWYIKIAFVMMELEEKLEVEVREAKSWYIKIAFAGMELEEKLPL